MRGGSMNFELRFMRGGSVNFELQMSCIELATKERSIGWLNA